jgi:hemerythrin superfamily protein
MRGPRLSGYLHRDRETERRPNVDALELLKKDHDEVKKMLESLDATTDRAIKTRQELFERLKFALTVHEQMEEAALYTALKEHAETKEIALEAYEEHDVVDTILGVLERTPVDDQTWHAKLTVMRENLLHHIEEEEKEMFRQVRQLFEAETLDALGDQMQTIKTQARAA